MNPHHAHFSRLANSLNSPKIQPYPSMTAKDISRYKNKTIPQLIGIASRRFNAFVRERDSNGIWFVCISCNRQLPVRQMNAGHYYSGGHYPPLRFNTDNVHGQCGFTCNNMRSGNLINYRHGLVKKIGEERIKALDIIADNYKRNGFKWDRFSLIEIILKYK